MKTSKYALLVLALSLVAAQSFAQTDQYQRPGKKKKAAAVEVAPAADASAPATADAKPTDKKSEKVDIQQIENQYWQQKDTDFHVVQSRRYTKEHRWFFSAGYGLLVNDSFTKGGDINLSGGYFFKEQSGVELSYSAYNVSNSKTTSEIFGLGGSPAYNKLTREVYATYDWMPIYGKVSVADKSIIYYDLGINVGLGLATYDHVLQSGNTSANSAMLVLDITQQFFVSDHWSIRFDVKNHYYNADRLDYKTGAADKDTNLETSALLGFVYYFGHYNSQK